MTDDQLRKTTGTGVAPNAWCHLCHSARHHLQLQRCVCCLQLGLNVLPTLKNCIAHYLHRTRNLYTLFARRAFAQGHSLPNRMTARAVKVPRLRVSIPERKSLRKKVHQKEIQRGQAPSKSAQGGKNTALCRGVACKAACLARGPKPVDISSRSLRIPKFITGYQAAGVSNKQQKPHQLATDMSQYVGPHKMLQASPKASVFVVDVSPIGLTNICVAQPLSVGGWVGGYLLVFTHPRSTYRALNG